MLTLQNPQEGTVVIYEYDGGDFLKSGMNLKSVFDGKTFGIYKHLNINRVCFIIMAWQICEDLQCILCILW